jgi:hypothetical protein
MAVKYTNIPIQDFLIYISIISGKTWQGVPIETTENIERGKEMNPSQDK